MRENLINNIYEQTRLLSEDELKTLLVKLSTEQKKDLTNSIFDNIRTTSNNDITFCADCGSIRVIGKGSRNGTKRYLCKDCKKSFCSTSNSMFFHFRKEYEENFLKYIECIINNLSLKRSMEICNISYATSFHWRHKILNVISNMFKNDKVTGLIEIDETYFRKSRKGYHKFKVDKPRRHGYVPYSEDQRGLSKDKICISTAIDRSKNVYADFCGLGVPDNERLSLVYKNRIKRPSKSKIICDGGVSYKLFAQNNNLSIKCLSKPTSNRKIVKKMPKIEGRYHIQNVNNFHGQIDNLLNKKYKGVSTKYLI